MNNIEMFELYENSAKHQSPDCNVFSEIEIIYCSYGKKFEVFEESYNTPEDQLRLYFNPWLLSLRRIPVEDQNTVHLKDRWCFFKTKQMLKKARQEKHGSHPTILSRRNAQEKYWDSMTKHEIHEREVMFFDRIARERHDYTATSAERVLSAEHWILRLNTDGFQMSLRQRPEFVFALQQCLKMQHAHLAETQQSLRSIRPEHHQRQWEDHHFEGGDNFDYDVDRKTGWRYYREPRGNLSTVSSSSTSQGQNFTMTNKLDLMAVHIIWEMVVISVPWKEFQKIDGGCRQTIHICAVQSGHKRGTHRTTRLAQKLLFIFASKSV